MKVKVTDGVATEIQPNFDAEGIHPANGRCCVKAYGAVQKTYNPNRVLTPMKRSNPKKGRNEDPGFVPISWDEALDTICDRLKAIREKGLKDEAGLPRLAAIRAGRQVRPRGTPVWRVLASRFYRVRRHTAYQLHRLVWRQHRIDRRHLRSHATCRRQSSWREARQHRTTHVGHRGGFLRVGTDQAENR
jgi:hypothetical protein